MNRVGAMRRRFLRRSRVALLLVGATAIALIAVWASTKARHGADEDDRISPERCQRNLQAIVSIVDLHVMDTGRLPESLDVAAAKTGTVLTPGLFSHSGARTAGSGVEDYVYVDWSGVVDPRRLGKLMYPLLYDNRTDWHDQPGVHILMSDHQVMWDPNAQWLRKFASEHPEVRIPLPSGITAEATRRP